MQKTYDTCPFLYVYLVQHACNKIMNALPVLKILLEIHCPFLTMIYVSGVVVGLSTGYLCGGLVFLSEIQMLYFRFSLSLRKVCGQELTRIYFERRHKGSAIRPFGRSVWRGDTRNQEILVHWFPNHQRF